MSVNRWQIPALAVTAGLVLAACSGSSEEPGAAFDAATTDSPAASASPVAEEPTVEELSPSPEGITGPTPQVPTFDTDWNPTLFPDDPDGPAYLTDTIDLKVGDPVLLPFDEFTSYSQDGGKDLEQGDGVGTECLRSQPNDPFTQDIALQASDNGPYKQGLLFFAQCPADVRLVLLNPSNPTGPDGVLHQYTITISE